MMANWENVELGSICEVVRGGSPRPIIDYITDEPDGVNWFKIGDVKETDKFFTHANEKIKPSGIPKTREVKAGDLILSNSMSFGRAFITLIDGYIHDGWLRLRCDESKLDKEYLYYFLISNLAQNQFKAIASGTVVNNLKSDTVKAVKIALPTLGEQKRIAEVLSMFDDKIKCNEEVNKNLEQQAQALFKSWFLDYEPWNGIVPDSWVNGKLGDFADIKRGGSPRPIQEYLSESGLRWLKISDVTSLQTPFIIDIKDHIIEEGLKKTVFLKAGSLVLSNSATPGVPKILDVDSCVHDGWLYFPESRFSKEYLYLFFKDIRQQLVNLSNGSVFNNLKTDILKGYPTVLPDEETLLRFDEVVQPMFLQMQNLTRESHKLADTRDAILPQLMSGELDVSGLDL